MGFVEDLEAFWAETQLEGFGCLRPTCSDPGQVTVLYLPESLEDPQLSYSS